MCDAFYLKHCDDVYMCMCMCACARVCMCACACVRVRVRVRACVRACVCVHSRQMRTLWENHEVGGSLQERIYPCCRYIHVVAACS